MTEKNKEPEKKEYTHSFKCEDCSFKFSFVSPEPSVSKFAQEVKIACPKCQRVWGEKGSKINHEIALAGLGSSMTQDRRNKLRKENVERSILAQRQAAQASADYRRDNPTVKVERKKSMGAPTQYGRAVEEIPKRVIDSLTEKATPKE